MLCLIFLDILMDTRDIRTLRILEEIDKELMSSQRHLAKKLNVSLGLVNAFVRRLANQGYFKIMTIPKKRVKYILTPKGASEKARLTYEYIQHSFAFYKESRQKIQKLFLEFTKEGVDLIVLYGTTDLAEIAYISLQETPIKLAAVVDDHKNGSRFLGHTVYNSGILLSIVFDKILITSVDSPEHDMKKILDISIPRNKVVLLS